jgi:hypothetical protein
VEFTVDLRPEEYGKAMLWHHFSGTLGKRINDFIGWSILVLAPLTIVLLLILAPDALSIWFWPVAIVATAYAIYSTIFMRIQIRRQAATILADHPLLQQTIYQVHEKGVKLIAAEGVLKEEKLFLPWKEIARVREIGQLYLLFVSEEMLLIVPKRTLPNEERFRVILREAGKLS